MATKLQVLNQIVSDLATVYPDLAAEKQIYLAPKIKALPSMAPLEIQVAEGAIIYGTQAGSIRDEDFEILVGIFRQYRLDSGGRHAKALTDLTLSLFTLKAFAIDELAGSFLTGKLLTRPCIIRSESNVTEPREGFLLKILHFTAGLNVELI